MTGYEFSWESGFSAETPVILNPAKLPAPMAIDPDYVRPPRDPERGGTRIVAQVGSLDGQLKHGYAGGFHLRCDEGEGLGGTNSAPNPLSYFVAGAGFCLSTQLVQVARTLKIEVRSLFVRVDARFMRTGSVNLGNAHTVCESIRTDVTLDTDEPAERIAKLIDMAEATCFVMAAFRDPVPSKLVVTANGRPFDLEAARLAPGAGSIAS
jgi:uncharacterized OsmC-like protein